MTDIRERAHDAAIAGYRKHVGIGGVRPCEYNALSWAVETTLSLVRENMPVSEYEALREVAQELVDVAAVFPQLRRYAGVAGSLDALRAALDPDGQESQDD